jgi:hypothetical protein
MLRASGRIGRAARNFRLLTPTPHGQQQELAKRATGKHSTRRHGSTHIRDFHEWKSIRASLPCGEQHAHVIKGDRTMLTSKAKLFAQIRTKLALATTIAALWMAAVPLAGAAAAGNGYPISAARAAAVQECSGLADDWGYAYRACMAQHGQQE